MSALSTELPPPRIWEHLYLNLWSLTTRHYKNSSKQTCSMRKLPSIIVAERAAYNDHDTADLVQDFLYTQWADIAARKPEVALESTWFGDANDKARHYIYASFKNFCINTYKKGRRKSRLPNTQTFRDDITWEDDIMRDLDYNLAHRKALLEKLFASATATELVLLEWRLKTYTSEQACRMLRCNKTALYEKFKVARQKWNAILNELPT